MKIDPRQLDPASASQAGKAQDTAGVAAGNGRSSAGGLDERTDRVDLSDLSGLLLSSASTETADRAARVDRLAAEVRSGRYQVDAEDVSRKIVDEAIGG